MHIFKAADSTISKVYKTGGQTLGHSRYFGLGLPLLQFGFQQLQSNQADEPTISLPRGLAVALSRTKIAPLFYLPNSCTNCENLAIWPF